MTWENVRDNHTILYIEHPLYTYVETKKDYYDCFKLVLDCLNGETMADYMSFFFIRDPINPEILRFADEDAKLDFYEWAVEVGEAQSLKEVHEGETKQEKFLRKQQELEHNIRSQQIQREKNKKPKFTCQQKEEKSLLARAKTILKLKKNPHNEKKIHKSITSLHQAYTNYKNKYNLVSDELETLINT